MSGLDLDLDGRLNSLELEWRVAYDASIVARSEYQKLAVKPGANVKLMDQALDRLERAETMKERIMARIERLEDSLLGGR